MHHPQGALGFRIEEHGRSIVFAPDREHGDPKLDALLRHYSTNADLLILDSQYTPEEYEQRRGWGHSTWLENNAIARDAGALSLALFHHDPNRDDDAVDAIVQQSRSRFEAVSAAREGAEIVL